MKLSNVILYDKWEEDMDNKTLIKTDHKNETPENNGFPLGRLFLAAGICVGLFIALSIMKFVFHLF